MGETVLPFYNEVKGCRYITEAKFLEWYAGAWPGDNIVYVHGDLALARSLSRELRGLAFLVYEYSKNRKVCLTQKRIGYGESKYIVTKRGDKL